MSPPPQGSTPTVVLTFDLDWAPEEVVADTIEILERFPVGATFFATHASALMRGLERPRHELAIHPNFNPLLNGGGGHARAVIDDLMRQYPEARGSRAHSLVQGSPIYNHLAEAGLRYDCSLLLPYQVGLRPHTLPNGLVRIPYFWEDDAHFAYRRPFVLDRIDLDPVEPNIFDFHPVHIYLNTEVEERYLAAKPSYQDPRSLLAHRNVDTPGTRSLLIEILEEVAAGRLNCRPLVDSLTEDRA